MTDSTPPQSDQNLPVPVQQTTAIARPMGGRQLPPPSWQSGEPEAVPWEQYIDALRRRWWVVVLVALAGSAAGRWYSKTVPSEYQTSLKIFVAKTDGSAGGGSAASSGSLTITTLRDMVKTPIVVAPVVRALNLNVHYPRSESAVFAGFTYDSVFTSGSYRFTVDSSGNAYSLTHAPDSESATQETGVLGDSVGRKFGLLWQPSKSTLKPKQKIDFYIADVIGEAVLLTGKLGTNFPEEGGQILTLGLTTNDKYTIAPTLNAWAQEFVRYVTERQRANLVNTRKVMETQLDLARRQMDAAARALQTFRTDNILAPGETVAGQGGLVNDKLQLNQTQSDLARVKEVLRGLPNLDENRLYASSSLMAATPTLSPALTAYSVAKQNLAAVKAAGFTNNAKEVQIAMSALAAVRDTTIPGILRGIEKNLEEKDSILSNDLSSRQAEIKQIPQRVMEDAKRQREYNDAVGVWSVLNQSYTQVKLADEQTATANLTIMGDAIAPEWPSSSRGPRLFILAALASVAAGLAIALLLDRLDRRFRYPQQATMELGLTIAGTIPFFKPNRKGELNLTASAQVVESFRTLRLATQYHFPPGEPVVVCISSPGPGEGKSLVSSNLAVAFANAGQKTLLIDGDVRRGVVHTTFESERRPGLVDYLGGTATPAQIVRPTSTDNLFIIPSGSRSRRAPELLTSDRMATLVAEMRTQYEVIIIDSAPFVAGMDSFALGAAAGTMLVVLRPGLTDRKLAENKLELVDRLPITVIGAVLNAISGGRAYRYYSEYTTYEGEDDIQDEADFDGPTPPTSPTRLIGRR